MHRYILYITDNGETLRDNWRGVTIDVSCLASVPTNQLKVFDLRTKMG